MTSGRASAPLDEPTDGGDRESIGALLHHTRLARGITVAEASHDTRISQSYLEALEAERWDVLPAPVYTRGFLRSYGRHLRIDADTIEALMPRNLPRPIGLDPAPGLRRRGAEPRIPMPSLPSFRSLPSFGLPRASTTAHATTPRTTTPRSRRPSPPAARVGARQRPALRIPAMPAMPSLEVLSSPRVLRAAGVVVLVLALLFGASRLLGGNDQPDQQAAGSTPGASIGLAGATPSSDAVTPAGGNPAPAASEVAPATVPAVKEGEMPNLTGLARKDAEGLLGRLGLNFVVIEVANDQQPLGSVFNQSPQPGRSVKRGDSVTILVSRASR